MTQYPLPLTLPAVYAAGNFIVSASNREAWGWVDAWPRWPANALLLHGPSGSGKTHLGHVWAARAGASILSAGELQSDRAVQPAGALLLENIEWAGERPLLHLFNAMREQNAPLLLTSGLPPRQLPFTLPDLTSRLLALPAAAIAEPDDAVVEGSLRKQFADRQIKIDEEAIAYLLPRVERSLARIQAVVEQLDKAALAERKHLTIPFIRRTLGWA